MAKEIKFWEDARDAMFRWIEKVAKAVIVTMWPKGRNVVLDRPFGPPQITNDWATIAWEIELEDKFENMWASLVKESAGRTNDFAGDGTTTATLLTYALASEWLKSISAGINAVELKNGMKKAWEIVVAELEKNSIEVSSKEELRQVASISAQDSEVWDIIAEAMEIVGKDGIITVEEGQTFGMSVEVTKWMQFDNGFLSPYMITNPEKMISEVNSAMILVTDKKLSQAKQIVPILEKVAQTWVKDLVIIADDIEAEALTTVVLNRLKWAFNVLAMKSPWFGDRKKELLKDIAILTWANIISDELWLKIENAQISDLWNADSVVSTQDKTTIIWWAWENSVIENRVNELKSLLDFTTSNYDKDKIFERIAKLASWVAVIKVWAMSEVEMKEKKLRIEDALNATRAAAFEGIVAWWWTALLKASKALNSINLDNNDQNIWAEIVRQALSYPVKQIASNAWKNPDEILEKLNESPSSNYWYDANKDAFVSMIEEGIIDPTKVERIALSEAISLAWMFLTTQSAIIDTSSPELPNMPPQWAMNMPPMM